MVVASHARGGNWVEWARLTETSQTSLAAAFFAATRAGTEWVLVFFVLSGFLVGGKVIERLQNGCFSLRDYAIDRLSRIWVPLLPALAWSAAVAFWVGKPASWASLFGNILGLQVVVCKCFAENIPLWSLAYEVWFYFLAGCAGVWVTKRQLSRVLATLGVALVLLVFTELRTVFLSAWVLGALTYWMRKHPPRRWVISAAVALILLGYASSQVRSATVSVDTSAWLALTPTTDVAILMLSLGMALALPVLTRLRPSSSLGERINHIGQHLAAFSYTLYLTHYPALYVWEHYMPGRHTQLDGGSLVWYALRVLSCVVFAWLFYLPFEKQTAAVRKWLRRLWSSGTTRPRGPADD